LVHIDLGDTFHLQGIPRVLGNEHVQLGLKGQRFYRFYVHLGLLFDIGGLIGLTVSIWHFTITGKYWQNVDQAIFNPEKIV
jgi:hypothetical protein